MLASQRDFAIRSKTKASNRLRAVLLEADPAFEAAVDPSSGWRPAVLAELGGPFGIRSAGLRRFRITNASPTRPLVPPVPRPTGA